MVPTIPLAPMAFETTSVAGTVVQFTESKYSDSGGNGTGDARLVLLSVENADVRFTFDGTTPAPGSYTGHVLAAGSNLTIMGLTSIKNFKMVRNGSTSANATITYFK